MKICSILLAFAAFAFASSQALAAEKQDCSTYDGYSHGDYYISA